MHVEFIERPVVFVEASNDDEFCESGRTCRRCAHSRSAQRRRKCNCSRREGRIIAVPSSSSFVVNNKQKQNSSFSDVEQNKKRWTFGVTIDFMQAKNSFKKEVEELLLGLAIGKTILFNKNAFPAARSVFSFFPAVQLNTAFGAFFIPESNLPSNIGLRFSAIFSLEGGLRVGSPKFLEVAASVGPAVNFALLAAFGNGFKPTFIPILMPLNASATVMVNIASTVCVTGRLVLGFLPFKWAQSNLLDGTSAFHSAAVFFTAGFC